MPIDSHSYSSVAAVAALAPLYTDAGVFTATTRPTLTQVERFIDQVSGAVNVLLAAQGFEIPITQADAKAAIDGFVALEAVSYVEYANSAGPWVVDSQQMRASSPARIVLRDVEAFIASQALGFEALGATRTRTLTAGLAAVEIAPIWDMDWSG